MVTLMRTFPVFWMMKGAMPSASVALVWPRPNSPSCVRFAMTCTPTTLGTVKRNGVLQPLQLYGSHARTLQLYSTSVHTSPNTYVLVPRLDWYVCATHGPGASERFKSY